MSISTMATQHVHTSELLKDAREQRMDDAGQSEALSDADQTASTPCVLCWNDDAGLSCMCYLTTTQHHSLLRWSAGKNLVC